MILQNDFCLNSHFQVAQSAHLKKNQALVLKSKVCWEKRKQHFFGTVRGIHYNRMTIRVKFHKLYQAKMKAYEES
jgi:ribosomal protein L35AE/L33A